MKKSFAILFFISLTSLSATAQNKPQDIIDEFFKTYKEKGSDEALDYIFSTNNWMDDTQKGVEDLKYKLKRTISLIGDYYGHESIVTRTVKDRLQLHTFIVKYDRQPLRFSILFYKPNDTWRLQNFKFDDNLDEELEEASKAYRLEENLPY